ncbi:MAG: type I glutamate--ammonia ligase [Actinomycetia bacterium]|nr:type I glutamate--ammonia ligase [Actinomycetes bacterium]
MIKDKEYVLKKVKEEDVRFIRLWFTDILGFLKSVTITASELEISLGEGTGFDGSSIHGFSRIDESDMIAMPDPKTFQILPWKTKDKHEARMFCNILEPDKSFHKGDPRWVLKKNLKCIKDMGYTFFVGPELEYFYFKNSEGKPEGLDEGGYFDLTPPDIATDLRKETILALQALGIDVESSHHEGAPSQHEIDLKFTEALTMADITMTSRLVVKEIAVRNGVYATFMPKPVFEINGSGMHTHMSLYKNSKNIFFDPDDEYKLSIEAKRFIAGLLRHAPEITLVTNQWVNSYKRLVPGYEAPVYLSWALRNRSDLIRIPVYRYGQEQATRIEYRAPDPACNPYLAFSVMLAAGLEGIKKEYDIIPPVERNVYEMTDEEREKEGIGSLPGNLSEAIELAEKSEVVRKAIGDHVFDKFIENKKIEWDNYRNQVTNYEIKRYLPIL